MQVRIVQTAASTDPEVNRAAILEVSEGADLVVFPEAMSRDFGPSGTSMAAYAEPLDGPFVSALLHSSHRSGAAVAAGMFEVNPEDPQRPFNTLVVAHGGEITTYRKVHLYDSFGFKESEAVTPGPVVPTVLDLGANVDCTPEHLLQFAVMGSALVAAVEGKENPSVGLLNIGEEAIKGSETIKQAGDHQITVEKMALDDKGFPQPTGEFETLEADSVVLALGQDVDLSLLDAVPGLEIKDGVVQVSKNMMTSHAGIFAGGDMVPAERNVTVAVGHGKKAAKHIDAWLRGASVPATNIMALTARSGRLLSRATNQTHTISPVTDISARRSARIFQRPACTKATSRPRAFCRSAR